MPRLARRPDNIPKRVRCSFCWTRVEAVDLMTHREGCMDLRKQQAILRLLAEEMDASAPQLGD